MLTKELTNLKQSPLVLLTLLGAILIIAGMSWWSWLTEVDKQWLKSQQEYEQLQHLIAQLPTNTNPKLNDEDRLTIIQAQVLPPALVGHLLDLQKNDLGIKARVQSAPAVELMTWIKSLAEQGVIVSELHLERTPTGTLSGMMIFGSNSP